ncbi:MAG: hypothetical protein ACRD2I_25630 [Vicinamibacterales bacterium]
MVKRRDAAVAGPGGREQEMRNQEVLRANRDLAAYFKGLRTEREARTALKIIKSFIRDRERQEPKTRTPLPGTRTASAAVAKRTRVARSRGEIEPQA